MNYVKIQIGGWGRYQKLLFLALSLVGFPNAFHGLVQTFIGSQPAFICADNEFMSQVMILSIKLYKFKSHNFLTSLYNSSLIQHWWRDSRTCIKMKKLKKKNVL